MQLICTGLSMYDQMRIISGIHRGRRIPFNNSEFGNARVTSDFVKEAVFGSLGPDLSGRNLLDLFAGSGQIGYEAISRGAPVWMNERDRKRSAFIESMVTKWSLTEQTTLTTEDAWKLIDRLAESEPCPAFDLVYIDPPYDASTTAGKPLSLACLETLATSPLLSSTVTVFVQHDQRTDLPTDVGNLSIGRSKRYSGSKLSTYCCQST